MPLSKPAPREALPQRRMDIRGCHRDDGMWDIEGHIIDTKDYVLDNAWRGHIPAGEPLHEMWIRLTVDDDLMIHAAEASTENSPFAICPEIAPNFAGVGGMRSGPGWMRKVREVVGGAKGCTLVLEMLRQVGTTA